MGQFFVNRPIVAMVIAIITVIIGVVSLAGVPLTAGFLGKFFVFNLAVDQGHWVALAFAVLGAAEEGFEFVVGRGPGARLCVTGAADARLSGD